MEQVARSIALIAALAIGSCKPAVTKPAILEYPRSEWSARAKALPASELIRAYQYHLGQPPPHDTAFEDLIGARGKAGIGAWLDSLEAKSSPAIDDPWTYGPLIFAAGAVGHYDLCADPAMIDRATRLFVERRIARDAKAAEALLRKHCVRQ